MELKEYLQVFKKQKNIIMNSVIMLVIFTTIFTLIKPITYDNNLTILISRKGTQATADYKYDGYYAVQASDVFADNISQWLASPSITSEIYSRAGVKNDLSTVKQFSKLFKAKKLSSQYVEVDYVTNDQESSGKIAHAIVDVLQEKTDSLMRESNEEISFKVIYNDPLTIKTENNIWWNNLLAILGGLFLGVFLAFGKNYFN